MKIQTGLPEKTVQRIRELRIMTNINNKTSIVAKAVNVFHVLESARLNGGRVVIEYPDGNREMLR